MSRDALDRRVLAVIGRGVDAPLDEAELDALALELFAWQHEHCEAYRRLCAASGRSPDSVGHWTEIPAAPTGAFKEARLAAFPESATVRVFRTSGSTAGKRGELHLDTLELYTASLLATFGAHIVPEARPLPFVVLAPPASQAPDSSLSYMYDVAARHLGRGEPVFCVTRDGWDPAAAIEQLRGLEGPAAVVGTAFAFVHLIDALGAAGEQLRLPAGTRVMETGGFKGRSRELTRDALHAGIESALGVARERIVNQYGMCELGSQFYEDSLRRGRASEVKRVPPWVRTRVVDPATLREAASGEVGMLVHLDLANTGSVLAVQTSDAGRAVDGGFEVLGRLPGAEARGCSLAADALLGGAA